MQEFKKFQDELNTGNIQFNLELRLKTTQKNHLWIELANTRKNSPEEKLIGILSGVKIITAQKLAEQETKLLKKAIEALKLVNQEKTED